MPPKLSYRSQAREDSHMKRVAFRLNLRRTLLSLSISFTLVAPLVSLAVFAAKNKDKGVERIMTSDAESERLFVPAAVKSETQLESRSPGDGGRNAPGAKPQKASEHEASPLALSLVVNRTDDIAPRGTGSTCITPASTDCTLREAVIKANTSAGSTITFAAGTNGTPITLALANSGSVNEDASLTGDLDVTATVTINGNGAANTIIQAGTTNANGIDKVFGLNPICTTSVSVSIDGVTIRNGRNTQPFGAADFSFTGGGLDFCAPAGSASLSLTNSNITDNTVGNGY